MRGPSNAWPRTPRPITLGARSRHSTTNYYPKDTVATCPQPQLSLKTSDSLEGVRTQKVGRTSPHRWAIDRRNAGARLQGSAKTAHRTGKQTMPKQNIPPCNTPLLRFHMVGPRLDHRALFLCVQSIDPRSVSSTRQHVNMYTLAQHSPPRPMSISTCGGMW